MKTAYIIATGEIVCTGDLIDHMEDSACTLVEGGYALGSGYFLAGAFVPYSSEQIAARKDRPRYAAVWSNDSMSWVDQRTLDEHKAIKWQAIKAYAQGLDTAPITLQGHDFATDAETRTALFQQLAIAREAIAEGVAYSLEWGLADESTVTLNANQLRAVVRAIDARSNSIRATSRVRRAQIMAATTVEQINAISW